MTISTNDHRSAWPHYWPIPQTTRARFEMQRHYRPVWPEEAEPADMRAEREERERRIRGWESSWRFVPSGIVRPTPETVQAQQRSVPSIPPLFDPRTCVHEASHAVADDEIGRRIVEVFVAVDGSGVCRNVSGAISSELTLRQSVVDSLAAVAAGRIGERLKFGSAPSDAEVEWRVGTRPELDAELLQALPRLMPNEDAARLRAEAEVRAELILRKRWSDVEKVAAELERRGRLTGAAFYQIIGKRAPGTTHVRRVEMPMQTRAASVTDVGGDTFRVCWGSGEKVKRNSYDGYFWEDLPPANADLTWMNSGKCPLLDTHNSSRVNDVLGAVVENTAFAQDGKGYAKIVLGSKAPVNDIKAGRLRNLSIGYSVGSMERNGTADDGLPIFTVKSYRILELSIVPVPADKNAEILRTYTAEVRG